VTPSEGYDKIVCCINSFAGDQSEAVISIAARAELAALCARLAAAEARAKGLESGESFRTLTAMVKDRDKRIDALAAEVKTWKANHDEMKARNKLLRNRPDLPMERVVGYDDMMQRLEKAEAALAAIQAVVDRGVPQNHPRAASEYNAQMDEIDEILQALAGRET